VNDATIKKLEPISDIAKTIVADNLKEFAKHNGIDAELGSSAYFADSFSSWQRGRTEILN